MMPMPIISSDIIDSIRVQTKRAEEVSDEPYYLQILKEMDEDNPNLAQAIRNSLATLIEKTNMMPYSDDRDKCIVINILNLTTSVYQSIKQQILCDELEQHV